MAQKHPNDNRSELRIEIDNFIEANVEHMETLALYTRDDRLKQVYAALHLAHASKTPGFLTIELSDLEALTVYSGLLQYKTIWCGKNIGSKLLD